MPSTDRWNIRNTLQGLRLEQPASDIKGEVKKGSCSGRSIKINHWPVNKNSLIKYINSQLENSEPKLKKGILGFCSSPNKKIREVLIEVLKIPEVVEIENPVIVNPTVIDSVSSEEEEVESTFTDALTSLQEKLHSSLRPVEKELYEHMYKLGNHHPGIFADLLLLMVKDRINSFKVNGNDVILHLAKGNVNRKLLGFDLTATLPSELTLRYNPENRRLFFVKGEIPFNHKVGHILTPEYVTLSHQGIKIKADFSMVAKISGQAKHLDKSLSRDEVFDLFN